MPLCRLAPWPSTSTSAAYASNIAGSCLLPRSRPTGEARQRMVAGQRIRADKRIRSARSQSSAYPLQSAAQEITGLGPPHSESRQPLRGAFGSGYERISGCGHHRREGIRLSAFIRCLTGLGPPHTGNRCCCSDWSGCCCCGSPRAGCCCCSNRPRAAPWMRPVPTSSSRPRGRPRYACLARPSLRFHPPISRPSSSIRRAACSY